MNSALIGALTVALTLLFIAGLIYLRRERRRLFLLGSRAPGRIVRWNEEQGEGGVHYMPVAEFSLNGQRFEAKGTDHRDKRDPAAIGRNVEIVYLNPRRAIFSYDPATGPPQIPIPVVIFLGLMACLVAAIFIWAM